MKTAEFPQEASRTLLAGKETIIFVLLFAVGVATYSWQLTYSDIWIDESFSKALARCSLPDLLRLIAHDFHPPLYFVALKVFTAVVGNTDFTIRLFSVLGALGMLTIGYVMGQRVFGRSGALYWSVLLLALPMPGLYSHVARMYTWTAFLVIGVFLSAVLYAKEKRVSDLIRLGLFSVGSAYMHYYCLIAAFWTGLSLLLYLVARRNRTWRAVAMMGVAVFLLYLPWLSVLLSQAKTVQSDFWIPSVSWASLLTCYTQPFNGLFRPYEVSWVLMIVIYGLTLASLGMAVASPGNEHRLPLGFALIGFHATIATAVLLSLWFRPILYPRYVMTVVPLLLVPPVLAMMRWRRPGPTTILLVGSLACGLFVVFSESKFSYGPYQQSLRSLSHTHPEVRKILHLNEVTAGPFSEYGRGGPWKQYYLNNDGTSWYSNMNALDGMDPIRSLREMVENGEVFCLAVFDGLPLNQQNLAAVASQCDTIAIENVTDEKPYSGVVIKLHILRARL